MILNLKYSLITRLEQKLIYSCSIVLEIFMWGIYVAVFLWCRRRFMELGCLHSRRGEFDTLNKRGEYKYKGKVINHLKLISKINWNRLVVGHLNINSIRNKFEVLIRNVSGEVDLLMFSVKKITRVFIKANF